jgi:heat shock protein HslJ
MPERLMVAPETAPCTGVAHATCLQVKRPGELRWQLLHGGIEGFTYEPGVAFLLLVRQRRIDNPPADAPGRVWILQEIIGRHPIPPTLAGQLEALRGTGWRLHRVEPAEPFGDDWRSAGATLTFDQSSARIAGRGGCNRWFGSWSVQGDGTLAAQPFGSTQMACPSPAMEIEDAYLGHLQQASTLRWWGTELEVVGRDGARLLFEQLLE